MFAGCLPPTFPSTRTVTSFGARSVGGSSARPRKRPRSLPPLNPHYSLRGAQLLTGRDHNRDRRNKSKKTTATLGKKFCFCLCSWSQIELINGGFSDSAVEKVLFKMKARFMLLTRASFVVLLSPHFGILEQPIQIVPWTKQRNFPSQVGIHSDRVCEMLTYFFLHTCFFEKRKVDNINPFQKPTDRRPPKQLITGPRFRRSSRRSGACRP